MTNMKSLLKIMESSNSLGDPSIDQPADDTQPVVEASLGGDIDVAVEADQIDESQYDPDVMQEIADELEEFLDEMKNNIHEMSRLLVPVPRDIRERAKAYWIGHIMAALEADVASTINELREYGNHE